MMTTADSTTANDDASLVRLCSILPYAWGGPAGEALFKQHPEDFMVSEALGFKPDGKGEHLYLYVEKRLLTTTALQLLLARHYSCALKHVAYAGMKDKQGITRQWFCVHLPGKVSADENLPTDNEQFKILKAVRNQRKLKRGSHRGNAFSIRLRDFTGDREELAEKIRQISEQGAPNYFGPQRFGWECGNVIQAREWFSGRLQVRARQQRSMLLSASRSFLFNRNLAARVEGKSWQLAMPGEQMSLDGSGAGFAAIKASAEELHSRLKAMDIHPSGPMWGAGKGVVTGDVAQLEERLSTEFPEFCLGLEEHGLTQERRPLRMRVQDLCCELEDNDLLLSFTLGKGSYATAVLRELIKTKES